MTKKRLEAIVGARVSPTKAETSTARSEQSTSKVKPKPKEVPKPQVKPDRSLKHLEALHEQTGVKESLHLGDRSRIKLDTDLQDGPKRGRKPVPVFDLEFACLDDGPTKPKIDDSSMLSDSDDDLPDARGILSSLRRPDPRQPTAVSDSTDYGDPEFDALIADLPLASDSCTAAAQEHVLHPLGRVKATATPVRKRRLQSSESPRPTKRPTHVMEESSIEAWIFDALVWRLRSSYWELSD